MNWRNVARGGVRGSTDEIGDVEAVGEPAGGAAAGVVDAVGWGVGAGGRREVVVVAGVHERVSEHEEGPGLDARHRRRGEECGREEGEEKGTSHCLWALKKMLKIVFMDWLNDKRGDWGVFK